MLRVPLLRAGKPYRSLDEFELRDIRTGEPVAAVSQANRGMVARDLLSMPQNQAKLGALSTPELLAMLREAAELFVHADLPVDPIDGVTQSPDEFVQMQSATTGMPHALCRANMKKLHFVMAEMETVLAGLTRGLDLTNLDRGWGTQDGRTLSYLRHANVLGAVLPSNSPGVHSLWVPAIALKVPVFLKPGSQEPWTPMRVLQALKQAGCPEEALSFYPTSHSGAAEIMLRSDRSMIFGDASTVESWGRDPRVQIHGPGWSKVILGEDVAAEGESFLDLMVTSAAINGGRSCINASAVWTASNGRRIAEALAERLVQIEARPLDDPDAAIAAFSTPEIAHKIDQYIEALLQGGGAVDLTAKLRGTGRVIELDGCTFLQPTVIWCDDPGHPLAKCEFLFPFVTVVECAQDQMLDRIGPTLVATALTHDEDFCEALMSSRSIDRLNLGEIPTSTVSWDQPHEGNLFEHLYKQRAFQSKVSESAA